MNPNAILITRTYGVYKIDLSLHFFNYPYALFKYPFQIPFPKNRLFIFICVIVFFLPRCTLLSCEAAAATAASAAAEKHGWKDKTA